MSNLVIVAGLLSSTVTVVKTIEAQSVEAKSKGETVWTGEFKRELAIVLLREVYNMTNSKVPFETLVDTIKQAINAVVAGMNLLGIFKKA